MSQYEIKRIYERYKESIWRYSLYLARHNRADAEDLYQESFARFVRRYANGQIDTNDIGPYLKKIVRNVHLDICRRRQVEIRVKEELGYRLLTATPSPSEDLSETVLRVLERTLQSEKLPDDVAEILRSRLLDKDAVASIADHLQVSRWTVRRKLKIGLRLLRNELEKEGVDIDELE